MAQQSNNVSLVSSLNEDIAAHNDMANNIKEKAEINKEIKPIFETLRKHHKTKSKYGKWKVKEARRIFSLKNIF